MYSNSEYKAITARILAAAESEFLKHGFNAASLRQICAKAHVTTGAFYRRFGAKEDIFEALVGPLVDDITKAMQQVEQTDYDFLEMGQPAKTWEQSMFFGDLVMLNKYKTALRLLLHAADGTRHADFPGRLVKQIWSATNKFLDACASRGYLVKRPQPDYLLSLMQSYYGAVLEFGRQDFTDAEALEYWSLLNNFFNWPQVIVFKENKQIAPAV